MAAGRCARWKQLRQGLLADAQIDARIDKLTAGLTNAATRQLPEVADPDHRHGFSLFMTSTQSTWQAQVDPGQDPMRTWLYA